MKRTMMAGVALGFILGSLFAYFGRDGWLAPSTAVAQGDCVTFPETKKTVCGLFLRYWRTHGGLAQQGFPISDVFEEKSDRDGKTYRVQYFERAVFEHHPEYAGTEYEVLLSLLGSEKFERKFGNTRPDGVGRVGDRVARQDTALTVLQAPRSKNPIDHNGRTYTPKPGYLVVLVEVVEENIGTVAHDYNRFNYTIRDVDGFEYKQPDAFFPEFLITSGTLAPGARVRGIVPFEVKETARGLTLEYDLFGRTGSQIRIALD